MHISILLMEQIIELFIMILMGFIIVKAGIVKDEDSKVLSKIVLYLIIPCVIINAFQVDYNSKTVRGLLIAFAASVILQLVLLFIISAMGRLFLHGFVSICRSCVWLCLRCPLSRDRASGFCMRGRCIQDRPCSIFQDVVWHFRYILYSSYFSSKCKSF